MKKIGIIGGMGSVATAHFFKLVIDLADAKKDEDYPRIVLDNNPSIPSRVDYVLDDGEDFSQEIIDSAKDLISIGAQVLCFPCNTAHTLYHKIQKNSDKRIVNMVEESVRSIRKRYPEAKKVGILSTEATIKSKIYDSYLEDEKLEIEKPKEEEQAIITRYISDIIKPNIKDYSREEMKEVLASMKERGVDIFLLACTEISVLFEDNNFQDIDYIDTQHILAEKVLEAAGY